MKIYQESAQIREALQDLKSISGTELSTFLQCDGQNIAINCHINKIYQEFGCCLSTYNSANMFLNKSRYLIEGKH